MGNALIIPVLLLILALLVAVALARIFFAAVLPVLRNWRLARRGLTGEPSYRDGRGGGARLLWRIVPILALIAILAAIALPAFLGNSERAQTAMRDQRRIADLQLIQVALDYYHLDHGSYPVSETETYDAPDFAAALDVLVTNGYLTRLPDDPGGAANSYVYQTTADGSYYCLGANTEGPPPSSTCNADTLGSSLDANYAVGP